MIQIYASVFCLNGCYKPYNLQTLEASSLKKLSFAIFLDYGANFQVFKRRKDMDFYCSHDFSALAAADI